MSFKIRTKSCAFHIYRSWMLVMKTICCHSRFYSVENNKEHIRSNTNIDTVYCICGYFRDGFIFASTINTRKYHNVT